MGIQEILIIALVLLVLFGAKRIPDMMKNIGKGISEFNSEKNPDKSLNEESSEK
jgi:sec-independent protein translocase protein TatA